MTTHLELCRAMSTFRGWTPEDRYEDKRDLRDPASIMRFVRERGRMGKSRAIGEPLSAYLDRIL